MMASLQLSTIPLKCTLCPKQPSFSDVSHLLTHVSSKGHLSCYFRQRVRASSDLATRAALDEFDRWYRDWNIEALLAERMNTKDRKNRSKAPTSRSNNRSSSLNNLNQHVRNASHQSSLARSFSSHLTVPDTYHDSQASYSPQIKREHSHSPWIPHQSLPPYLGQPYNLRDSTVGRVYNYAESPYASDYSTQSSYPDPPRHYSTSQQDIQYEESTKASVRKATKVKQQEDSDDDLPSVPDTEWDEVNHSAKLKGTVWPGMSIFDSATPAARRRRNQKKAASVLEQLENNSLGVENTENVWHADGTLKKQKEILGIPSSSSPAQSPCLTSISNPNLTMADFHQNRYNSPSFAAGMTPGVFNSHEAVQSRVKGGRKAKRKFAAYRDDDDDDEIQTAAFAQPSEMSYLTRGMSFRQEQDDVEARPARRRMREDRRLDNQPYENMLPPMPGPHGKSVYAQPDAAWTTNYTQNMRKSLQHYNARSDEQISQGHRGAGRIAHPNHQPSSHSNSTSNQATQANEHNLRGIGAQFADVYGNPTIFTSAPVTIPHHGHGRGERRSLSAVAIEDLVHNYAPATTAYLPSEHYQHLTATSSMSHAYDISATAPSNSIPILPPGFDFNNLWAVMQQHNSGRNATWAGEPQAMAQHMDEHQGRQPNYVNISSPVIISGEGDRKCGSTISPGIGTTKPIDNTKYINAVSPIQVTAHPSSTPAGATEDEGRTITAPGSPPFN